MERHKAQKMMKDEKKKEKKRRKKGRGNHLVFLDSVSKQAFKTIQVSTKPRKTVDLHIDNGPPNVQQFFTLLVSKVILRDLSCQFHNSRGTDDVISHC